MTNETIIRYFLNAPATEAQDDLAAQGCADEKLFAQMQEVEEELILNYLNDELTPPDRALFEENYLATEPRREQVVLLAALLQHAGEQQRQRQFAATNQRAEKRSWLDGWQAWWATVSLPQAAGAIAIVGLLLFGGVFIARHWAEKAGGYSANFASAPHNEGAALMLTLSLSPGELRGPAAPAPPPAALPQVRLPLSENYLRLTLSLPPETSQDLYQVEITAPDGRKTLVSLPRNDARGVQLDLQTGKLQVGRYNLSLSKVHANGETERLSPHTYAFNVVK
jgi:hypothetical protein